MATLLSVDVGGTSIKSALWEEETRTLGEVKQTPTPADLPHFDTLMQQLVSAAGTELRGVAFSFPGAVNEAEGRIDGVSAVPYIHHFPIQAHLAKRLHLPITMANDANCAALGELTLGGGKGYENVLFLVIGTGIGGAVVLNGEIVPGTHRLAGEFGMMLDQNDQWGSTTGTLVQAAAAYTKETGREIGGKQLLQAVQAEDPVAIKVTKAMYHTLGHLLFSLQFTTDPEIIVIGGGASQNPQFIAGIREAVVTLAERAGIPPLLPTIVPAQLGNDANLVGAAVHFSRQMN